MTKYRALIVGAGRIGAGYNWPEARYVYTHADAYLASDRVELAGFVEPDPARADAAREKYHLPVYSDIATALERQPLDIVSICTPPAEHAKNLVQCLHDGLRGMWIEKPLNIWPSSADSKSWDADGERYDWKVTTEWPRTLPPVQVNYIRRFDPYHRKIKEAYGPLDDARLVVRAKKDIHTVCHFTDLARFWGIPRENLEYTAFNGPNQYELQFPAGAMYFHDGGVIGGFMEAALSNLVDAVEGKADLLSPPESAIESERWANEILGGSPG